MTWQEMIHIFICHTMTPHTTSLLNTICRRFLAAWGEIHIMALWLEAATWIKLNFSHMAMYHLKRMKNMFVCCRAFMCRQWRMWLWHFLLYTLITARSNFPLWPPCRIRKPSLNDPTIPHVSETLTDRSGHKDRFGLSACIRSMLLFEEE